MSIQGYVKKDIKTKNLIKKLEPGDIALIKHRDLDEIAALSLVEKKVKAIINTEQTISGKYPNQGPDILLKHNIPIFESKNNDLLEMLNDNDLIRIKENNIYINGKIVGTCNNINKNDIRKAMKIATKNLEFELEKFISNTLDYAKKEKELVLGNINIPKINTILKGKQVLIVTRGKDYKKDLKTIKSYIKEENPVLIGVDGGGDALIENGYTPDIIIGDMDSVSDYCLSITREIIVHAYPNGVAPGLERINNMKIKSVTFSSPGTSEDVALLLAYNLGADLIVAVGTHTSMIDFLEKGRRGMASTFLVRLKVGSILVDAKGVNKLYRSNIKLLYVLGLSVASLIPVIIIITLSEPMRELLMLIIIKLRLFIGI